MDPELLCLECPLSDCRPSSPQCLLRRRRATRDRADPVGDEYGDVPLGVRGRPMNDLSDDRVASALAEHGLAGGARFLKVRYSRFRAACVMLHLAPPGRIKKYRRNPMKGKTPSRPVPAEGPIKGNRMDLCVFCEKRLDISGHSIAEVRDGVSCPACAKRENWKGLICPPRNVK